MKLNNKIILITVILTLLFSGCSFNNNYDYSYSKCEGGGFDSPANFVEEIYWEEDKLIVKPIINSNCAIKDLKEEVTVEGNSIVLNVDEKSGRLLAMCNCNYDTEFILKNLSKQDYNIVLKKNNIQVENFTIFTDGLINDKCSNDLTYNCYFPKDSANKNYETNFEVIYRDNEHKLIADKYPKFEEYIKKYDFAFERFKNKNDVYELYFEKAKREGKENYIMVNQRDQSTKSGSGSTTGLIAGDTFEQGVKNYIVQIEKDIGSGSFTDTLKKTHPELDIIYGHPKVTAKNFFYFNYNNETIEYSSAPKNPEIDFIDRENYVSFGFIGAPKATQVSTEQLLNYINISNKLYNYIDEMNYKVWVGGVDIDSNLVATFTIEKESNTTIKIHNKEINMSMMGGKREEIKINVNDLD